jgi:hypothetical protein
MTRMVCAAIGVALCSAMPSPHAAATTPTNPHTALRILHTGVRIPQSPIRSPQSGAPTMRVMILDGESGGPYHRWQVTTTVLKAMLTERGLFSVGVVTAPGITGELVNFKPAFSAFDAVVLNYDAPDERWPAGVKEAFENYVRDGGGVVVVHAADNAFPRWKAFNEMIGIGGWRDRNESSGPRWYMKGGALASDIAPGPAGSHGTRLPFTITAREPNHPILRGLPPAWMHQGDELYASLRGPGHNMTVLATAYSDPGNNGTGRDEPQLLVVQFGRGRVFHTTLQRGVEWVATGAVTQKVPAAFPTATTVSYRADLAAMDPIYKNGLNPLDPPHR